MPFTGRTQTGGWTCDLLREPNQRPLPKRGLAIVESVALFVQDEGALAH
jgi:hypothetical protein